MGITKKLWNEIGNILQTEKHLTVPSHTSCKGLANSFVTYFSNKIDKIHEFHDRWYQKQRKGQEEPDICTWLDCNECHS